MAPEKTHTLNMTAMHNMIALAENFTPAIPFVFASSTTVFAKPRDLTSPIDINHPVEGASQYTKDKIACEILLQHSKLDWRILRLSVVMNPTYRPNKASIKYGLLISLDTLVEPIHVKDAAIAFFHAVRSPNASHKIFIIAGGEKNRMTYQDYIFGILKCTFKDLKLEDISWHLFLGQKKNYLHWYDTRESQMILNFQQRTFKEYCVEVRNELRWWEKLAVFLLGKQIVKRYFN